MNTDKATPELFAALAVAQGEIENAEKNSVNPHFKSKYADLAEVLNTIRPVFAKHGLSLVQSPSFDGHHASVTTIVTHKSGGFLIDKASCVPAKTDGQGIGAATTYLRRYAAAAFAGIAQEDDDGETAKIEAPRHTKQSTPASAPKPTPAQSGENTVAAKTLLSGVHILSSEEVQGKNSRGPWTLWAFTLSNDMVAKTFNEELAQAALDLVDDQGRKPVDVEVGPGRKPGTIELISVSPADDVPT